jgi:hypothetical protein
MADEEIKMIEINYNMGNYMCLQKKKKKDGNTTVQNRKAP